jgi:hypothetical protein
MHSEHLTNVQFSWVAFAWFIAVAAASGMLLLMEGSGLLGRSEAMDALSIALAVAVGWGIGGFLAGFRVAAAPILHGAAIALLSFVAWFILNLTVGGLSSGRAAWEPLTVRTAALGLLVQGGAAILGAWLGYRMAPVRVK